MVTCTRPDSAHRENKLPGDSFNLILSNFQFLAIDDFGTAEDRDDNDDSDDEDVVHPIRIIPSNLQDVRDEFQPFPHVKC